jgi:hypothetical protein
MNMSRIKEHMEVIGADGVHVGTVDRVENNRIKLTKTDNGEGKHQRHYHYIDGSLVADVEGNKVRLLSSGSMNWALEMMREPGAMSASDPKRTLVRATLACRTDVSGAAACPARRFSASPGVA